MKTLLFLLLVCSASALPVAIELPAKEVEARAAAWLKANPTGFRKTMTAQVKYGSGNSMKPLIQPGDVMLFEAYVRQPVKGEVVLFDGSKDFIPISHFCLDETEHSVLTKGINNQQPDGYSSKAWVKGVLVGILRKT